MSFVRRFSRILYFTFAAVTGLAQSAPPVRLPKVDERWTIESALARALEANPEFLAAKAEHERQEGVRMQARARLLPQLNLSASSDKRDQGLTDRSPQEFNLPPNERSIIASSNYDAHMELRQLIFDGFDTWNQAKKYRALELESRFSMESAAQRTIALVRQAFDAVLWRREALAKERERVTALQQVVDWTVKKQEAGEVAEYEKYRAQAELKLAEADLAQALSNVAKAEQAFRRLLMIPDGIATGSPLLIEGELKPRILTWTLSEAIAMAHARRPDLSAAAANLKAAQHSVHAAYGSYLPKVEAYVSYGARSSYYDETRRLEGWSGGAAASWNIFDGLETRGRIKMELASRRAAEVRLEDTAMQIDSQLRELYAGVELARSMVEAQRGAADLAGRSLSQARRLHQLGQISLEQVLQAELTSRQAELGWLEAIFNHNSTITEIEYSVGSGLATSATPRR